MDEVRLVVGTLLFLGLLACSDAHRVALEFRVAEDTPAPGLSEVVFAPTGERFYLRNRVSLTQADVDSAAVVMQQGSPAVALVLTPEGALKFGELTEQNVGKRCAMVVDGELVSAPRIMAPIHAGRAIISGDFTESEARRIARGLLGP